MQVPPDQPAAPRPTPAAVPGFSLLELLVALGLIAILATLVLAVTGRTRQSATKAACLSNLRQIGVAAGLFAGDNNYELPGRTADASSGRWPRALAPYLKDTRLYAAPGDPENWIDHGRDPLDDNLNHTSFILNGFNDLVADGGNFATSDLRVRTTRIERPSEVILFGMPVATSDHFYMDVLEGPNGNHADVLNLSAYTTGSCYLFADGSARFLTPTEHEVRLWFANKTFNLP